MPTYFGNQLSEDAMVEQSMAMLAATGGSVDELATVTCNSLNAVLGAGCALYGCQPDGSISLIAASRASSLPRRIVPQGDQLVGTALGQAGLASSRRAVPEPPITLSDGPYAFAIAWSPGDRPRGVLVLSGDAVVAIAVATSKLPERLLQIMGSALEHDVRVTGPGACER